MKLSLILIFALLTTLVFGQDDGIGFQYSFEVEISDEDLGTVIKKNLESKISKSYKVYYTDQGVLRHILKPNNYINSSIFNNDKNELTIFGMDGIISKESGLYNKPEIINVNSDSVGLLVFRTTTGTYNYYYNSASTELNSSNYGNLGEHCFSEFINETGVIPEQVIYEMGIMKFVMKIEYSILLTSDDVNFLNEIISQPSEGAIKKFIEFSEGK